MSLLTITQNVLTEIGLPTLSTVAGNSNRDARLCLQLLNRGGKRLAKFPWKVLQKEHTFQLQAQAPYYDLPEDFGFFLNGTIWDRVESRPMSNVNPQVWQEYKSGLIRTAIYKRYRVKAESNTKKLWIDPTPATSQCTFELTDGVQVPLGIAYEYVSSWWAQDSSGEGKTTFTADSDTGVIDEEILELDLKWRLLKALEQEWQVAAAEWSRAVDLAIAQEGGAENIRCDGRPGLPYPNIPETGVGF